MPRITRAPPKPKTMFVHQVRAGHSITKQAWLWEHLERIAGSNGYRKRTPFWSHTIFSFVLKEQADELTLIVRRRKEAERQLDLRSRPCPSRVRYEEAAAAQHAIIWGLSTGVIREVVRTYRRERRDCSTHGHPNWIASNVIPAAAPSIGRDRARLMVDTMLSWVIARHRTWFWTGLQGDRTVNKY